MKNFILYTQLLLALAFTSCEPIEVDPKADPKDSTLVISDKPDSLKLDLIAYYPFNNNVNDYSGNKHHGISTKLTAIPDRFGRPNSAYYFDGDSAFIKVNHAQDLLLNNKSYTINYWINLDGYNVSHGSAVIFKRGAGSNNGWVVSVTGAGSEYTNIGKVGVPATRISAGDDPLALGNQYLEKQKWYMITSTYDANKKEFKIYVNGKLDSVTQNIPSPNPNCTADMYIGRDSIFPENGTPPYFLKGKLDDIFIYGRTLTDKDINALFVIQKQITF